MRIGRREERARRRRVGHAFAMGLAAIHASAAPAVGQQPVECSEGRIREIVVDSRSVFDLSDAERAQSRFAWAFRLANRLHVPTREEVIGRELLFEVGDCLDSAALEDSERMLRGFGFIASAAITAVPDGTGGVRVVVETRDEWSTRLQPKIEADRRLRFEGFEVADDNLLGTGRHVSLFYELEDDERVYGAGYQTPQLLRSRADLSLRVARTEAGEILTQSVAYPFVGEVGRRSWRQLLDRRDRYFEILIPRSGGVPDRVWVPVRRETAEIAAAIRRAGSRYRQTLFAAALAAERVTYPAPPIFPDSAGRPEVPAAVFTPPWRPLSSVRVAGMMGRRDVRFVRRQGFDTVHGEEDIQLGLEAELSLSAALPGISPDQDVALGARAAWSGEPASGFAWGAQLALEARHAWAEHGAGVRDVLAEADAWTYLDVNRGGTQKVVASASFVTAAESRVPLQLSLGGDTGLRGLPRHLEPGGRRWVASVEHRAYLGTPFGDLVDLGSVAFLDVGKIWPGDVPFGRESPVRGTVGLGLRAAFPAGSRQVFRADVGLPIRGDLRLNALVFSIGTGQVIGRRVQRPDPQLVRSANYGLATSDFLHAY